MRPINMERLWEATDEQIAEAYAVAIDHAHNAPKEMCGEPPIISGSMAWARFSSRAFRISSEIVRRKAALTQGERDE
jgi:hypothetical protein